MTRTGFKLDRLDADALDRIRETPIWEEFQQRIADRLRAAKGSCCNGALAEKDIRMAQGEVAALSFVLGVPDTLQKEIFAGRK